jgi:hypothetical protein
MAEQDKAGREEDRGLAEASRRMWERWCKRPAEQTPALQGTAVVLPARPIFAGGARAFILSPLRLRSA